MGSTPVDEETSVIFRYWKEGDQRYYFVPCPHCNHHQTLVIERLKWPVNSPSEAYYECEKCKKNIPEKYKTFMLEKGEWRPTNKCDPSIRSYHLNSLYSPVGFLSWAEVAES